MASTPLQDLVSNPLDFLKLYALQLSTAPPLPPEYLYPDGTLRPGNAYLKLDKPPKTQDVYNLVLVPSATGSTDKDCILAYVLGFVKNKGNDDVAWVDIQRNASTVQDKKFLFTVGLTGCSVVVTRVDNANTTYRVFHDRRMDSAVLYENVEMCVNFNDYRIGGSVFEYLTHTGNAITCMQFKAGVWKMYLQRQLPVPDSDRLMWEVYAVEQKAETVSREYLETNFNNRRTTVIQNRIKSDAKLLGVDKSLIDGAKDGEYRGSGQYDDEAIRSWNELRTSIKNKIAEWRQEGKGHEETLRKYEYNLTDSRDIDETWVWLQIKKKTNKGPNA